jgi:hypothetical protein
MHTPTHIPSVYDLLRCYRTFLSTQLTVNQPKTNSRHPVCAQRSRVLHCRQLESCTECIDPTYGTQRIACLPAYLPRLHWQSLINFFARINSRKSSLRYLTLRTLPADSSSPLFARIVHHSALPIHNYSHDSTAPVPTASPRSTHANAKRGNPFDDTQSIASQYLS